MIAPGQRMRVTATTAVVLHALALAFAATEKAPPPSADPAAVELDPIEIVEAPTPLRALPVEPAVAPVATTGAPSPVARPRVAAHARAPGASSGGAAAAEASSSEEAAPGGTGLTLSPETSAASAPAPDALPPPLLPRAVSAPWSVLEGPLAARSAGLGLSTSSQVTATVQRVAQSEAAPANGHGMVRITVEEDGTVSGVTTTSPSWAALARALRAALAGRRFRAPGRHGAVLSYAVDAVLTRAPALLTGEKRATASPDGVGSQQGGMSVDKAPQMAVIDYQALLPVLRHVVKVELLREDPR